MFHTVGTSSDGDLDVEFSQTNLLAGLVKAVTAILPDIVEIAGRQPDPAAQAKAEASVMVRQQKSINHPSSANDDNYMGQRKERYDTYAYAMACAEIV